VYLWRKISTLEAHLRADRESSEERRSELEKARKDSRERRDELEDLRKQLQDTKAKLKRQQKDPQEGTGKKRQRSQIPQVPDDEEVTAAAIVRVGDREIEEAHRKEVEKLDDELDRLESELKRANETIDKMKRAEERRKEDAELAAKALAGSTAAAVAEGATQEEKIAALTEQLETLKRAAAEEQKRLSSEVTKLEVKAKNAQKRASNNHSLYLVVKGQLELAEDKLALLRMKYEGAKKPEGMRSAQDIAEEAAMAAEAAVGEVEADMAAASVEGELSDLPNDEPAASEEETSDEATA
jgi:chromosome segregation ATPase